MTRFHERWFEVLLLATCVVLPSRADAVSQTSNQDAARSAPQGLGSPGKLIRLSIQTGQPKPEENSVPTTDAILVRGSHARQQLLVTGHYQTGQLRDHTRSVTYHVEPQGVVTVDSTGRVTPLQDGTAVITAIESVKDKDVKDKNVKDGDDKNRDVAASVELSVERWGNDPPVNFPNQIVPIFTKLECNSGGCHGKSSGQNGFRLSLLGFEPTEDFEHLVKEARARRVFLAAPGESLLLKKATAIVPHGGGQRLQVGEPSYELMRRWIAEGAAYGDPDGAKVDHIESFPSARNMPPNGQQQLLVLAHYTDGTVEDVTTMAQYEPNATDMAEVSDSGLVTTMERTGDVAVMVRYQSHVDVFRATIPLGAPVDEVPSSNNFIDELVFKKLRLLGLPPSPVCDDATFLRRTTIDIAGRLPTCGEVRSFLADRDADKRDRWIDRLLDSPQYADYFASKWSAVLRNKRRKDDYKRGTFAFHEWIRQAMHGNLPYDQMVRQIVAASGELDRHPPVMWYREVNEVNEQVEDTAQLFLGQRLQCARCHHHPFEKWSQDDYYSFAAFFSRVGRKGGEMQSESRIFHRRGLAHAVNPKTGQNLVPTGLGMTPVKIPPEADPRHLLVDWMVSPQNKYFARSLVNRYWKHFFNRGIVEPEDDLRETNPASNPELLDKLTHHFINSGFDLKELVRIICRSHVYQLTSMPNEYNADDRMNFSRYYPRRLSAEVLLDAINTVTDTHTEFKGTPRGTRAVQLPDSGFDSYFLTVFGRPASDSACECERQSDANLAQGLHLINSSDIHGKLSADDGRAARLAQDGTKSDHDKVAEIFLSALAREPSPEEVQNVIDYLDKKRVDEKPAADKNQLRLAYEDILWTLINTKEFLFNH